MKTYRKLATLVLSGVMLFSTAACVGSEIEPVVTTVTQSATPEATAQEVDAPKETEKPKAAAAPAESVSQEQARLSAESYMSWGDFSEQGLVDQLKFEKFSAADAEYAVGTLDVDWNEQAAMSATSYLETMAFSREGLIAQLEFEGFTTEQATYGVDSAGL